jgi:hypothetical protein
MSKMGEGDESVTTDIEIRTAFHHKNLRQYHACPRTLVLNELAIAHASARVDIAVIDGCVHGYEIKSAADTLSRLPRQMALYEECLEKLTIVSATKHLDGVGKIVPAWCGIIEADKGPRGGIHFKTHRAPQNNVSVKPDRLAHLLWRQEAIDLLASFDLPAVVLSKPRQELYKEISARLSVPEITEYIRMAMARRPAWRDLQAHALCGG